MFLKEKKYEKSLQCFQNATHSFSKIFAKSKNIGVALCSAAEGYLLYTKSTYFEKQDDCYQNADKKLQIAYQIYKDADHIAGQAFCIKH